MVGGVVGVFSSPARPVAKFMTDANSGLSFRRVGGWRKICGRAGRRPLGAEAAPYDKNGEIGAPFLRLRSVQPVISLCGWRKIQGGVG